MAEGRIPWWQRIQARLTAAIIAAMIVPMGAFELVSSGVARRAELGSKGNELKLMAEHASMMIHDRVLEIARDVRQSIYEPDVLSMTPRDRELYLSYLLHLEPRLAGISAVSLDGRELVRVSRTDVYFADDLRDLSAYAGLETVRRGKTFYGDVSIPASGEPQADLAVPVLDAELRPEAMLLAEVPMRELLEGVQGPEGRVYVVDEGGGIIGDPDFSLVLAHENVRASRIVAATLSLRPGQATARMRYTNERGEDVIGVGRRGLLFGWGIIAEQTLAEALAAARETGAIFAIVFALAAAAGVGASLLIGAKAAGSFRRLQQAAQAIGRGDLSRRVERRSMGEVGALERDLNLMADRLEEYYRRLEDDVTLLNERVAERTASLQAAYDDLQERDRQLKEAQAALVQTEKLASLGGLVAGIVHEINNPLAYVSGNMEILKRDLGTLEALRKSVESALAAEDPARRTQLIEQASREAKEADLGYTLSSIAGIIGRTTEGIARIRKIVADLRDFSRMGETQTEPADLNELVEKTLSMLVYELRRKNIVPELQFEPLPSIRCSPGKINQVLLNVIANAIQAVSEGGHIRIATRRSEGGVAVSVKDDGHGVPPGIIGRIFDPFFTTRPRGEGTGLGLSVSYGIIRDHHGRIDVKSEPGKGAEFTIWLPAGGAGKADDER